MILIPLDSVYVGAEEQGARLRLYVDLEMAVYFKPSASPGTNNIEISWTKEDAEFGSRITNCRYYGGVYYAQDSGFGNPELP